MTNNLVPTQIVDRNGKLTTVHRKLVGDGFSSLGKIAPPTIPVSSVLKALLPDIGAEVPDADVALTRNAYFGHHAGTFLAMSKETRRMAVHLAARGTVDLTSAIIENPCHDSPSSRTEHYQNNLEAYMRNHMLTTDCMVSDHGYRIEDIHGPNVWWVVGESIAGQSVSEQDPKVLKAFETREEVARAAAFAAFTLSIHHAPDADMYDRYVTTRNSGLSSQNNALVTSNSLTSDAIVEYLTKNPEEGRSLGEFIAERQYILDEDAIEGMIRMYQESKANTAMQSGFL